MQMKAKIEIGGIFLLLINKSLFSGDNELVEDSHQKLYMYHNESENREDLLKSKHLSKNMNNWIRDENSLEDLKVSSSDVNSNSLLKPNNLEYDIDDKENSILNHQNIARSNRSHISKDEHINTEDDENLSKWQSKIRSVFQISQFLGSISKLDDGFTEKINQYMQK